MRKKSLVIVLALLAAAGLAVGGVYVYDATRSDVIAEGVTVNGVDVGGLRASEARVVLRRALLDPLERPVVVRHGDHRYRLTARRARIGVDVDTSVDRALDASRKGSMFERTYRVVTGERVETNVTARVTYSRKSVRRLVDRVAKDLYEAPVDATVDLSAGVIERRPAQEGRRVREGLLRRTVTRRLLSTNGARKVRAKTAAVEPKITDDQLAARYPAIIFVNRSTFELKLYKNLEFAKSYRIAVGQAGLDTPAGLYHVQNKAVDPSWYVPESSWAGDLAGEIIPPDDPRNPIKARWMGIFDGAGIHGTTAIESIGTAASHGCVRMTIPDVIDLYDQVPVDSPVYIA